MPGIKCCPNVMHHLKAYELTFVSNIKIKNGHKFSTILYYIPS